MIPFFFALLLQGQLVYGQVPVVQNCTFVATQQPGIANQKIAMYQELKALPITAKVFEDFRIRIIESVLVYPTQPQVATIYRQLIFANVSVVTDFVFGFTAGEQNCVTWEAGVIAALVALNDQAVDDVLTKYKTQLVTVGGVPLFPR